MNFVTSCRDGRSRTTAVATLIALATTAAMLALDPGAVSAATASGSAYQLKVLAVRHPGATNTAVAVAADGANNVYIADEHDGYVQKVAPNGVLTRFAGNGTLSNSAPVPGPATSTSITPTAITSDPQGNVFVATGNYIVKITPQGHLSIVAGNGDSGGTTPGPATATAISMPVSLAVDANDNLFISNGSISEVSPSGQLTDPIPAANDSYTPPGYNQAQRINSGPIAVGAKDTIYTIDGLGYLLKVPTGGSPTIVAGDGQGSQQYPIAGPATKSSIGGAGLAIDGSGDLFIASEAYSSSAESWIEKVNASGTLSLLAGLGNPSSPPRAGPADQSPANPIAVAAGPAGRVYAATHTVGTAHPVDDVVEMAPTIPSTTSAHVPSNAVFGKGFSIPVTVTSTVPLSGIVTATAAGYPRLGVATLHASKRSGSHYTATAIIKVPGSSLRTGRRVIAVTFTPRTFPVGDSTSRAGTITIAR